MAAMAFTDTSFGGYIAEKRGDNFQHIRMTLLFWVFSPRLSSGLT
jgi:hypothetical protein